jgi:hypothetical protein
MVCRFEGFADLSYNVDPSRTNKWSIPLTAVCRRNFRITGDPTTVDAMWSHSPNSNKRRFAKEPDHLDTRRFTAN